MIESENSSDDVITLRNIMKNRTDEQQARGIFYQNKRFTDKTLLASLPR